MNLREVLDMRDKLDKGFTILVESAVYKSYDDINKFYLQKGAVGKVIEINETIDDNLDYEVCVKWLKNKVLAYSFNGNDYDLRKFINLKEFILPKNPRQLELIFS